MLSHISGHLGVICEKILNHNNLIMKDMGVTLTANDLCCSSHFFSQVLSVL